MTLNELTSYTKDLFPQTSFSIELVSEQIVDCNISLYGPSNHSGRIQLLSGKIYDTSGRFVSSYESGSNQKLEIAYKTGIYSLWVNDDLISASQIWSTGSFSYITGLSLYNSTDTSMDLGLSFYGTSPTVTFSDLVTEDLSLFSGNINITPYSGRLLGVYPNNGANIVSYPSSSFYSGDYVVTGSSLSSGSVVNIDFVFDFGTVNEDITVYYNEGILPTGNIYTSIGGIVYDSFISGSGEIYNVQYQDAVVISSWNTSTNLEVYLRYMGRSGESLVEGTGTGYGSYSGYINGSGYLSGSSLTGTIYPYEIMGVGRGNIYSYTTGTVTYEYLVSAIGYESGNLATGVLFGELTGIVGPGSGYYQFNQNVTGTPTISVWDGGLFFSPTGAYTGAVNQQVILSKYMIVEGSSFFIGTGINENHSGSISGFNLITGNYADMYRDIDDYLDTYNNYYNYGNLGFYSGDYLRKTPVTSIYPGLNSYGVRITYDQVVAEELQDYVQLIVKNEYETHTFELKGYTL